MSAIISFGKNQGLSEDIGNGSYKVLSTNKGYQNIEQFSKFTAEGGKNSKATKNFLY